VAGVLEWRVFKGIRTMTLHVQMPALSNLFQSTNGFASIEHSQAPVSENHHHSGSDQGFTTYQGSAFGLEGQSVNSYLQPVSYYLVDRAMIIDI